MDGPFTQKTGNTFSLKNIMESEKYLRKNIY